MFRKLIIIIMVMLLASTCFAPYPITYRNVNNKRLLTRLLQDRIGRLDSQILELQSGTGGKGTGNYYYVDSGKGHLATISGKSWAAAEPTLNDAVANCTDNNGDVIFIAQGHNESLIAADGVDINKAGVKVIGIGDGWDRPRFHFDHVDGEFVIGAKSVTIVNLTFYPSESVITHCIDIEDTGDYAFIYNCEFYDGEAAGTDEFIDTIQVGTGATDVVIAYNKYFSTGTGTNNFVDLSAATIVNPTVIGNDIYGAFAEAGIWADSQVPTKCLIANNIVTNTTGGQLGIEFMGNATGWMISNLVSTNLIGSSYDPGQMGESGNMWDDFDTYDTAAVPWTTNETGVNRWSASELTQMEGEAEDAIEADDLDHLINTSAGTGIYPVPLADDSILAMIMCSGDPATPSSYNNATDSLQAIRTAIDGLTGVGFRGTITAAGAVTLMTSTDLAGFGDDFFNTGWRAICTYDQGAVGAAPEGEIRDIEDYTSGTGVFAVDAWSTALAVGDEVYIRRVEELNLDDITILGGSGEIFYVDAGRTGTPDVYEEGRSWVNAYTTVAGAIGAAAANNGDVIYVAAGHSVTIGAATIALNVAGIKIIGKGEGSQQPTWNFDDAASTIVVSVADVYIENFKFLASTNTVAKGIDADGSADGLHLKDCRFVTATSTDEFAIAIELMTATDDVVIEGCEFLAQGGSANEAIKAVSGILDNLQIIDCYFNGDWAVSAIWSDQANTNCLIKDNVIHNSVGGQHSIEFTASMTGDLVNNRMFGNTIDAILDPGEMMCNGNTGAISINEAAITLPLSADTTGVVYEADGSVLERLEFIQQQYTVSKSITVITNGNIGLFTIANGPIQIVDIVTYIDVQIGAEGNLMSYDINPTTPPADTAFATTGSALETNGFAAGTVLIWDGVIANNLIATTAGAALSGSGTSRLVVPVGAIEIFLENDNVVSGEFTVYLTYRPLASNVTVVAQ